ncbi:ATP-dependent DNA ligase [Streptomyces massasporeus]|uniref:ATP-dependent DNA ligase n=1 Tax=Streptomyces massasporeus TaxID=67324 RepID=UPI0033ADBE9D
MGHPRDPGRHAVQPELVGEIGTDVARDAGGRWRHPARLHRPRTDLSPTDVPFMATPP